MNGLPAPGAAGISIVRRGGTMMEDGFAFVGVLRAGGNKILFFKV
jgi:hypothetical protein